MMKKIYLTFVALLVLLTTTNTALAQIIACDLNIQVTLDGDGYAILTADDLLESTVDTLDEYLIEITEMSSTDTLASGIDSIILDCTMLGKELVYGIKSQSHSNKCWGNIALRDLLPPIPNCVSFSTIVGEGEQYIELFASDFNIGSVENCGEIYFTFDPFAFNFEPTTIAGTLIDKTVPHFFDDNGPISSVANATVPTLTQYQMGMIQKWHPDIKTSSKNVDVFLNGTSLDINMTATDESGNFDYCTITATFSTSTVSDGVCVDTITRQTIPWLCGVDVLSPSEFIDPSEDYESATISVDGESYSSVLSDYDFGGAGNYTIYTRYIDDENNIYECSSTLKLEDNIPPVVISDQGIVLLLETNSEGVLEAHLTPEEVDEGSYDQCSDLTLELSKEVYGVEDIGSSNQTITATDESGNFNIAVFSVTVLEANCSTDFATLVSFPADIEFQTADVDPATLTPEDLVTVYGYTTESVLPTWNEYHCDDYEYSYSDAYFQFSDDSWRLQRSFTVVNWDTGESLESVQNITFGDPLLGFTCIPSISVSIEPAEEIEIFPQDIVVGGDGIDLSLTITDDNGNLIPNNIITSAHIGLTLNFEVTSTSSNQVCVGTLNVVEAGLPCVFDPLLYIQWPIPTVQLNDDNVALALLTPQYISENYGYDLSEVQPTITVPSECITAFAYQDVIVPLPPAGSPYFKIWRTFTVIEWNTGEVATYTHTITNTENLSNYICDYLPWNSPVTDCDQGHTLDDDVEWPAAVEINDHRITPAELVTISGIDIRNSEPQFEDSLEVYYDVEYQDVLEELTLDVIVLNRVWTVTRNDNTALSWNYSQPLTINYANFNGLVTVSTPSGKGLADVQINGDGSTNSQGAITGINGQVQTISKQSTFKEGINMLDLVLIRAHILGQIELNNIQLLAADINSDGQVTSFDILSLIKEYFERPDDIVEWQFLDQTSIVSQGLRPKGYYVGYKLGDIDDSYGTSLSITPDNYQMVFTDQLLNAGESYTVDLHIDKEVSLRGLELIYQLNSDLIQVEDVSMTEENHIDWVYTEEGKLHIISVDNSETPIQFLDGESILSITLTASNNGVLSEVLKMDETEKSVFIDANYVVHELSSGVENVILDIIDVEGDMWNAISLSPNPASSTVTIENIPEDNSYLQTTIYSIDGKVVQQTLNNTTLDISTIPNGLYICQVKNRDYTTEKKLIINH